MQLLLTSILVVFLTGCFGADFNERMDKSTENEKIRFYTVTINDIKNIYTQHRAKGKNTSSTILHSFLS